ncbi:MAG: hypothetical protein CR968_04785 [Flavobacteriia bacterium]|nr:MAG: hypothetical protein CR968_04785 [Flavobacteriia bacterium]
MDIALLIMGFILMLIGIVGSFLPVLPGPPLSWVGLLLIYLTKPVQLDYRFLGITLFIAIVVTLMDYIIPAIGTKKFGGTKYGMWGTTIGLLIGLVVPIPLGFIIGAFVGAYVGEMFYDSNDNKRALKAAFGSFMGFLSSTFLKFAVSVWFLVLFIMKTVKYWDLFF